MAIIRKKMGEILAQDAVELPIGYKDSEGIIHKYVKIKEMTGEVEEAIADVKVRDNMGKIITELVNGIVDELDGVRKVSKDVIRKLTTVDRDFIVLAHQCLLSEHIEWTIECPKCKKKIDLSVEVSDIDVGLLTPESEREFVAELRSGVADPDTGEKQKELIFILPTGESQERVSPMLESNPAQASTALLQMCTVSIGSIESPSLDMFRKMTSKDRNIVSKVISEMKLGADMGIECSCPHCAHNFETAISLQNLLGE